MKERPILYAAPMVIAYRADLKTQTRRTRGLDELNNEPERWILVSDCGPGDGYFRFSDRKYVYPDMAIRCPYGVTGDRLWTREAFALETECDGEDPPFSDGRPIKRSDDDESPAWTQPHYRATDDPPTLTCEDPKCAQCRDNDYGPHWQPSIFMPRWASRDTAEIISVRPERLQSITEADAIAEGVLSSEITPEHVSDLQISDAAPHIKALGAKLGAGTFTAKFEYAFLWDSINGNGAWAKDSWVWRLEFRRLS